MRRINLAALLGLVLLLFMPGVGAAQGWGWLWGESEPGEVGDRWRTGDRLYGTASATLTHGTLRRGEYRINAHGTFELRYSRSLQAWQGRSDSVKVTLSGRQQVTSGTGESVRFSMRGSATTDGIFEVIVDDDGTYNVRFYSSPIEYTRTSNTGHPEQRTGGAVGSDFGLPGNALPEDGASFTGTGVMLSPDEEGLTGRSVTRLAWSFSTTRPEDEVRIFMVSEEGQTEVTGQTVDVLVGQRVRLLALPVLADASRQVTETEWQVEGHAEGHLVEDWQVVNGLPRRTDVTDTDELLIDFAYSDGDASGRVRQVSKEVRLDDGMVVTGETTLRVYRPEGQVEAQIGPVGIGEVQTGGQGRGRPEMLLVGEPAGAVLTGAATLPEPFAGTEYELKYVQLVRQDAYQLEVVGYPNLVWMHSSTEGFLLDGVYPYPSERLPDRSQRMQDSPGGPLSGRGALQIVHDFQTHLMFRPAGDDNVWVPLRQVAWAWGGKAVLGGRSHPGSTATSAADFELVRQRGPEHHVRDGREYPVWSAVKPIGRDNWRNLQPPRVVQTTDQWMPPW